MPAAASAAVFIPARIRVRGGVRVGRRRVGRVYRAAGRADALAERMVVRKLAQCAELFQQQAAVRAVPHQMFAGRLRRVRHQRAVAFKAVDLTADIALPIAGIRAIVMFAVGIFHLFAADLALLIVVLMVLVDDPHILRLMPGRGGFFFLLCLTNFTFRGLHTRFGAGCRVGQLFPLVRGLLRKAAVFALGGMRIRAFVRRVFQLVCARHTDRLSAVLADLYAHSAALILILLMLMRAALDHAAAVADVLCRAVLRGDRLIAVMNGPTAVETGDAITHVIAVPTFTRTDIPAVGQRIAERQRIAVLQIKT